MAPKEILGEEILSTGIFQESLASFTFPPARLSDQFGLPPLTICLGVQRKEGLLAPCQSHV